MKTIWFKNNELIELLSEQGISMNCNDNMDITISDEDAARIPEIIERIAPAASDDYGIEEI